MPSYVLEGDDFFADPLPTLDRLREEAPVCFHESLGAWVLTRYADVVDVVRDPRFSVDRGGAVGRSPHPEVRVALEECNRFFGRWMVFSDPPRHDRLRDRVARAFTPARVRTLAPVVDAILERALARVPRDGEFDLVSALAGPVPAQVTSELLGLPRGAEDALHRHVDAFFALFGAGAADVDTVLAAYRALLVCREFFEQALAEKKARPSDDLLSALVREEPDAPSLEDDEMLGLAITLVAGAYGTTTHLIANATLASLDAGLWSRLAEDPSLAERVVEETLRFDGPAFSVVRRATCDVEVGGTLVPRDARVYCILHAANHDPAVFDEPWRFDPARAPNRHLGLGAGAHFCLGASLTRLETSRTLVALARAFPDLALVDARPAWRGNLSMRGLAALRVRASRDRSSPQGPASEP